MKNNIDIARIQETHSKNDNRKYGSYTIFYSAARRNEHTAKEIQNNWTSKWRGGVAIAIKMSMCET